MARIIAFAGSSRRESFNRKLIAFAVEHARQLGADVTLVELSDFPMPLYNGDLEQEQGHPEHAQQLYEMMKSHDGLLLACPEYNSSITPLLKNTIDWLSRPRQGESPLAAFTGKTATLLSASPGQLGGLRGLVHVRSILGNIGVIVLPNQVAVSKAGDVFDESGAIQDSAIVRRVQDAVAQLVDVTDKLNTSKN